MRVIADLHIHSRFSRATSQNMDIPEITRYAKIKGLKLVGTGDFTHPKWFGELSDDLTEVEDSGLYGSRNHPDSPVRYMLTAEVCTTYYVNEKNKRIHHVIFTPNLDTAAQISDRLKKYGDLTVDGRPFLEMTSAQLVEEVMEVSDMNEVVPAHVWTPWFSLFGAFSGFDTIEDCYEDMTKHIHALETGLSSDPPMNWRLSSLDRFTLISNSDCHSHWPWRIGREANVFELDKLTYGEVVDAIRKKDPKRFKFTIETNPAYGKYHWSGHRNCNISLPPAEAIKYGNRCPKCGRKLTRGVDQRIEELADRPADYVPANVIGYKRLLPLHEIIKAVIGVSSVATKKVWSIYDPLIKRFGDEYTVLMDAPRDEMVKVVDAKVADAVIRVREEKAKVIPGYDGVYGELALFEEEQEAMEPQKPKQKSMADFI
ncbi:MAG: endonuclease Q family protein [Candidatus Bathyarchaeota archaeon]|nr:endonuclease Q family protein [Candidatus Bathyarchaeota archaeon]